MKWIILFGLLFLGVFVFAYSPYSNSAELSFNLTAESPYVNSAEMFFNFTAGSPANDSCTYSGGTWNVDCSDNCEISTSYNLSGQDMNMTGTGIINLTNTIYVPTGSIVYVNTGCRVNLQSGGMFL